MKKQKPELCVGVVCNKLNTAECIVPETVGTQICDEIHFYNSKILLLINILLN